MRKKSECIHLSECQQKIQESDLDLCEGDFPEWDQEDCFKYNDLGMEVARRKGVHNVKLPSEWKTHPSGSVNKEH